MKNITLLGATGSIGLSTLDVIAAHPERYHIRAITANTNVALIATQCVHYQPEFAVMADADAATELAQILKHKAADVTVLSGAAGLLQVVEDAEVDYVMAAIVGAAGLLPTLAAAKKGKRVLLANKEALVMSGQLFIDAVAEHNAELIPIDSEHNAIFQCLPPTSPPSADLTARGVSRILLTASGGPFLTTPLAQLAAVTPAQACAHPNWSMGKKISVDSATMMNKGLELIEACWLFNVAPELVEIVIHPQSIIHSMVEYIDGSVLAQLSEPDMRTPIAYGLAWPERISAPVKKIDLLSIAELNFLRPDAARFPCLSLARAAMQQGGTSSTILNAANEVAVAAFLAGQIKFTEIAAIIAAVLEQVSYHPATSLALILADDQIAREQATRVIEQLSND